MAYATKAGLLLADLGQEVAHLAGGYLLDASESGEDARRQGSGYRPAV